MKKLLILLIAVVFSITNHTVVHAATADGAGPWADNYNSFVQGKRKDGDYVKTIRSNPEAAIGESESEGLSQESTFTEGQFLSLGFGGKITLKFTNSIVDGTGDDLMVYEVTGLGKYPIEKAMIEASSDGINFIEIDEVERDGSVDFDNKISCVHYVRITDTSDKSLPFGTGDTVDGFDLDGIEALNTSESACVIDDDNDGVPNYLDKCPESKDDKWEADGTLGINRWMYDDNEWRTKNPKSKQVEGKENPYQSEQFSGCTCTDILDVIKSKADVNLEGHYKFGCSKSILEDWYKGEYHVGFVPFEIVEVPGTSSRIVYGTKDTELDKKYELTSSGTYKFVDWDNAGIADASCSLRIPGSFNNTGVINWIPGSALAPSYTNYLELWVNGAPAEWGECNKVNNTYTKLFDGTGVPFSFKILDNSYGDNSGSMFVEIKEDKWVNLW